ncbi:MAG: benzoyl-CoA reductase, bzd-type, subunit Q [Chloroflexi bacterium]|nr:benzoyl-CoA reductase, bzd-type, subunit Q [Chloroflexota bacterium]
MVEEKKEYWRWTEGLYLNKDIDWRKAKSITLGVDIGSVSTQAVVLTDGKIYCFASIRTGSDSPDSARKAVESALKQTDLKQENIHYTVGTGYGRVNIPFANKTVTEIACHARGANYMGGPTIRTILDMGGQDCKAIQCDERGKVVQFLMNDKCAAGTGRGMEVIANLMAVPITDIGRLSFEIDKEPPPVSSTCVVFAKTEAIGLMREGWTKNQVLAAYCSAMAHRVVTLLQRVGVNKDFTITGGIAKNIGVTRRILNELKVDMVQLQPDPQIAGGVGASLFAADLLEKQRKAAG